MINVRTNVHGSVIDAASRIVSVELASLYMKVNCRKDSELFPFNSHTFRVTILFKNKILLY